MLSKQLIYVHKIVKSHVLYRYIDTINNAQPTLLIAYNDFVTIGILFTKYYWLRVIV